jgi:hypothetical protein
MFLWSLYLKKLRKNRYFFIQVFVPDHGSPLFDLIFSSFICFDHLLLNPFSLYEYFLKSTFARNYNKTEVYSENRAFLEKVLNIQLQYFNDPPMINVFPERNEFLQSIK